MLRKIINKRISYDTNQRLPIVAKVIKADLAFITGKIETKTRFLAMRHLCWLLASQLLYPGKSIKENLFHTKKTLQASPWNLKELTNQNFLQIILLLHNDELLHSNQLHSKMLQCNQDDDFGSLSNKHVPKHLILKLEFYHLLMGYLGLE